MAVFPALLLVFVAAVSGQDIQMFPQEAVVKPGESLEFYCKVPYRLNSCRVQLGNESFIVSPDNPPREGEPVYHGAGYEKGECGARITNIREQWNGNVECGVTQFSREVKAIMKLTVARAPGRPELTTSTDTQLLEGKKFTATCRVPAGRPAANITWFLDDEEIVSGLDKPVAGNTTSNGLEDITQHLTKILTADDDRRELICRATHPALPAPLEAKRQLNVLYPPRLVDGNEDHITIFGLKLQEEGRLNVTIRSNPPPEIQWRAGDHSLVPEGQNMVHKEDSEWIALQPVHLPQEFGRGVYNITLLLKPVTKEAVDTNFFLMLTNPLGKQDIRVQISTLDEPAGVELDAGAIVGIVVGVLVLLLAVFLVVFAKATDRWCFAGSRARDHTKSSGESDTESAGAAGRVSRLGALGARVRAALPRGKDKVQATEPQDKALAEEKKGVVYAELALAEQTAEKPQPPSTEYAEIVYTEQPKEEPKE